MAAASTWNHTAVVFALTSSAQSDSWGPFLIGREPETMHWVGNWLLQTPMYAGKARFHHYILNTNMHPSFYLLHPKATINNILHSISKDLCGSVALPFLLLPASFFHPPSISVLSAFSLGNLSAWKLSLVYFFLFKVFHILSWLWSLTLTLCGQKTPHINIKRLL